MKKKVDVIFIVLTVLIVVACCIHTAIRYYQIDNDELTSAPASIAFFLLIPYAVCLGVDLLVWYIVKRKNKKADCKKENQDKAQ